MPFPVAAAIMAGASVLGSAGQAYGNAKLNKKTIKYNKWLYAQQRQDSLADWNMQNDYNSPAGLRKRGLNPALAYGSGSVASSADMPRQSNAPSWNPQSTDWAAAAGNALGAYQNGQLIQEQVDNLKAQREVMNNDAILKSAQTLATLTSNDQGKFNLDLDKTLRAANIDAKMLAIRAATAQLRKTETDTTATSDANARENQLQPGKLQEQAINIGQGYLQQAKTKSERDEILEKIKLLKQSQELNKFELQLNKKGFTKSDPVYYRIGSSIMDSLLNGKTVRQAVDEATDNFKKHWTKPNSTAKDYKKSGMGFFYK